MDNRCILMNFEIYNDSIAERKILTINFATVLTTSGSIEGTECRQRVLSDSRLSTRIYKSTTYGRTNVFDSSGHNDMDGPKNFEYVGMKSKSNGVCVQIK
uniref:Uncharacterized protein n=2 Tax=Parascaris univalens TaxID=6257 RepID=A0A915A9I1_PARUN